LLAATWASMVSLGREGYLGYAKGIFETSFALQDVVRAHEALRVIGNPSFCFSFTSDELDIYHINDFMRTRGWRFNGQQYPNAIHMAVTRPQVQDGVVAKFTADLAEAVEYAAADRDKPPASGAIYGGVDGGITDEADDFMRAVMGDMMDKHQALP
jgi:glutamate/tyrosine decarboxylase-like PLP-dependent enzyme